MKAKAIFLAVSLLIGAFQASHAAGLARVSISGSIIEETGTNGATATKPITVANVLDFLGISGTVPLKDMHFYYDSSGAGAVLIEPEAVAVTGTGTPTATLLAFGNTYVFWDTPNNRDSYGASNTTGLNGDLTSGTVIQTITESNHTGTLTTDFYAFGTISGKSLIMKGRAVEMFKQ